MSQVQIFISYRRDDSAGYARALYTDLARQWGADRVFMDVDDIGAGQPFADVIRRAVGASEVLLVLIGPRWHGPREGQPPRLHDSSDFVQLEVAAALARGMQVIPVLLDGARMPEASSLPAKLQALAGRHALELRHSHYAADLDRLLLALRQTLGEGPPSVSPPRTARRALPLLLGVAAAALLAAGWLLTRPDAPARPDVNGRWQAEVSYDWPNSQFTEQFLLRGVGVELQGTASFLRVPREVQEGRVEGDVLTFVTRSTEISSSGSGDVQREKTQRYRARLVQGELHVDLQIVGGSPPHEPVSFKARRLPP